jgi:DNA-binding CsgD family transcriptional regulator
MLSAHPEGRPVHPAYTPLLYELSALRLVQPVWPASNHYCEAPGHSPRPIHFRAELHYAGLVAHHLAYLDAIGSLSTPWRVSLVAHLAGNTPCSFAMEPLETTTEAPRVSSDLRALAARFAERIRNIASIRLRVLEIRRGAPRASSTTALTRREGEVLDLFLAGLGVASISQRLFISPHTVRNHMKRLFAKFGVTSQRELREHFAGVDSSRN